jgi:hypothetical protein
MNGQQKRRPKPWVGIIITFAITGIAIIDQIKTGSVDRWTLGALLVLAFFWAGHSVDRALDRIVGRWFG